MDIQEGKTYYFYDDRAVDDVCKAHVLSILPHPEREDDKLVVYRWFGKHRRHWWYGVTSISQQKLWADYVRKVMDNRNEPMFHIRKICGNCGYFMLYSKEHGTPDKSGDCASLAMNKECNENKVDPFQPWAKDEGYSILQVDENETACGFFRVGRTRRVIRLMKESPDLYVQDSNFKPKRVR